MMSKAAAIEYGKRIGVRFYVMNTNGGLYEGCQTREEAEAAKKRWEKEDKRNPWTKGTTQFVIREAEK